MRRARRPSRSLALEDDIVSGRIEAGRFCVRSSSPSARRQPHADPEALRRLSAHGLVSFTPNRGVRVRTLSRDELREAFLVLSELEHATELAVPQMTPERLAELDAAESASPSSRWRCMKARSGVEDNALAVKWMQANYGFHDVIYAALESPYLERLAKSARRTFVGQITWVARPSSTSSTSETTASTARSGGDGGRFREGRAMLARDTCSTRGSCWTRSSTTSAAASRRSGRPGTVPRPSQEEHVGFGTARGCVPRWHS